MKNKKRMPTLLESSFTLGFMLVSLLVGYEIFGYETEPIIVLSAFVAGLMGMRLGYKWSDMEKAIVDKISVAMPAILVLFTLGFLIGAWMFNGTVPMIVYYGVQFISPQYMFPLAFIVTLLTSSITGASWGSAGTVGVAIMGVAHGLGADLAITAGAVVSGAYFGDKMSPISDTTNLASMVAGTTLHDHIRHMTYSTFPSALVALIGFLLLGLDSDLGKYNPERIRLMINQLNQLYTWNPILMLPALIIILSPIKKWPPIPTMLATSIASMSLGLTIQDFTLKDGLTSLVTGFNTSMADSNGLEIIPEVAGLVNRGGLASVTGSIVLVVCAMGFAGIMSKTKMLDVVLRAIIKNVKTAAGLIYSTLISCFTMGFVSGSAYPTILIPGELFKKTYINNNLHPKNLSRALEDAGTVFLPLLPWSADGAFMAAALGVKTANYAPYAILNYTCIIASFLLAFTGISITRINQKEKEEFESKMKITKEEKNALHKFEVAP